MLRALILALLICGPAWAQDGAVPADGPIAATRMYGGFQRPYHVLTGDLQLDRAMAICDAHARDLGVVAIRNPTEPVVEFDAAFSKSCAAVEAAWARSPAARDQSQRPIAAWNAADKKFVDDYAAGLR